MKSILSLVLLSSLAGVSLGRRPRCRCRPDEPCWPSSADWQALNASIGGALEAVRPVGYVCHDPTYNNASCVSVAKSFTDSAWRASQPGAVQWQNWEALPFRGETCYLESPRDEPCGQGRVSLYSARVRSAADVQVAVRFAKESNVRLAIKSSGHDFVGRSSAPGSLQLLMGRLKNITFYDDYTVRGKCGKPVSLGPAVRVGSGVFLKELYDAVGERNLTVVAGLSHTVAAAGGYVQGGGHSPLGTWKGMAADNVLEFEVVTADGALITANQYQYPDLFWALRGGGGGTFGAVISATLRTFADVPGTRALLYVQTTKGPNSSDSDPVNAALDHFFWQVAEQFHRILPALNDAGGAGYYDVNPDIVQVNGSRVSTLDAALHFYDTVDVQRVMDLAASLAQLGQRANTTGGNPDFYFGVDTFRSTRDLIREYLPGHSDSTGGFVVLGSRLLSRSLLASADGPRRTVEAIRALRSGIKGHVVAGGQVAATAGTSASLNPAWRKTLTHIVIGRTWQATTSVAEQKAIQEDITKRQVPLLKALEPRGGMGAYVNEADAHEVGFQESFWGANYGRLYRLKQRWDPDGLFTVRLGVGSEDWDEFGFCRIR
ncbi:hypothetical protein VTK73DRAFT_8036 [Phialemonium thermophilum]|uniref:FAD-binding PCMH-type domain-containing protein n=1 Tax=Phialemonium thermophilum TaxID=223376 RepID=A0ABR3WB37_9PEZI